MDTSAVLLRNDADTGSPGLSHFVRHPAVPLFFFSIVDAVPVRHVVYIYKDASLHRRGYVLQNHPYILDRPVPITSIEKGLTSRLFTLPS